MRAVRAVGEDGAVFVVASHPQDDPAQTVFVPDFWPAGPDDQRVSLTLQPGATEEFFGDIPDSWRRR